MNAAGGPDRAARDQLFSPLAAEQARAAAGTTGDAGALTFPDLPRLELDQLLGQVVERAQEVLGTQGRLRGLLRANQVITGDLALPVVLRRIADAARELVGARYAALGVIGPDGDLVEFVHVGMPADVVEEIGPLPQGKGLLGALIEDPQPIRLGRIGDDPRSSGFPPGHPPMASFLGVPIRIRDEVFGNLYLTDSTRGQFSAEDAELATALAATAAAAIDNARLYQAARSRGEWLQATAAITRQLLSPDPADPADGRCRRPAAADRRPQPGDRRRRPGHPGPACRERVRPAGRGGRRRRRRGSARPAGAAAGVAVRAGVHHRAAAAPGPPPRRGRVGVGRIRCPGCRPGAGGAAVWIDPGARGAVAGPDPRPARVHPRRPGAGRRVRQPGRGRDRAGRGPGRAATRRDARRARTDRRGPARPRHPTAVRHRPVPASPGQHPRAGPGRPAGTHRDRRPRRHHRPDPHQHLRAAAEPPDPSARPAGPPAGRGHRGDPGPRVRPGRAVLRAARRPARPDRRRTCWPCSARP